MARVLFLGTPDFALPSLQALMAEHEVVGVVTQPDARAGRRRQIRESPVKLAAEAAGIPVFQPNRLRGDDAAQASLRAFAADVFVVAAFGQILPQSALSIPPHGVINVHASLLPRWRGAAPIQAAIRAGDALSGITIMLLDEGLDTGPMLSTRDIPLADDETGGSLHDRLARLGADLLADTLPRWLAGDIAPQPQDDARSTYAPRIKKSDGAIDWTQSAIHIERLTRALNPAPGAYTTWQGKRLTIHAGIVAEGQAQTGLVTAHGQGIAIGTGDGLFCPARVQLSGKRPLPIRDFINGYGAIIGAQLG